MPQTASHVQQIEIKTLWEVDPRAIPVVTNQVMLRMAPGIANTPQGVQVTLGFVNTPFAQEGEHQTPLREIPVVPVGDYYMPMDVAVRLHEQLGQLLGEVFGGASQ